jgi:hypothetical protein
MARNGKDMSSSEDIIYRYWGKTRPDEGKDPAYHLLPYHFLDVAAVGVERDDHDKLAELAKLIFSVRIDVMGKGSCLHC